MGSFRLAVSQAHLHADCNFAEYLVKRVFRAVMPFVQAGTYPARDYATIGRSELPPAFTRASDQGYSFACAKRSPLPLTFEHWPGISPYTSPFGLAETYVF